MHSRAHNYWLSGHVTNLPYRLSGLCAEAEISKSAEELFVICWRAALRFGVTCIKQLLPVSLSMYYAQDYEIIKNDNTTETVLSCKFHLDECIRQLFSSLFGNDNSAMHILHCIADIKRHLPHSETTLTDFDLINACSDRIKKHMPLWVLQAADALSSRTNEVLKTHE